MLRQIEDARAETEKARLATDEARNLAKFWRDIAAGPFASGARLPWEPQPRPHE
jgi:hypothetical protein